MYTLLRYKLTTKTTFIGCQSLHQHDCQKSKNDPYHIVVQEEIQIHTDDV